VRASLDDAPPRQAHLARRVEELLSARTRASEQFFAVAAEPLARLCHQAAERFARGGRLIAIAHTPQARSDARHIAVEFVHPVIVGKRALPAIALTGEGRAPGDRTPGDRAPGDRAPDERTSGERASGERIEPMIEPRDIVIAFESQPETAAAIRAAARRGCLTVAFEALGAEWELEPPSPDPLVRQELVEVAYHLLWELVHVFFEHRGLLAGRDPGTVHEAGAASFLYPFLAERERDLEGVIADVRRSIVVKAGETDALRAQTLGECGGELIAAAAAVRARFDGGGALLALGNGGSATDAMDAVCDLRAPPLGWAARRAIDLSEDSAILTALANDIGVEAIFRRQVIAYGRRDDALLAFSTSGGSANVLEALAEARGRGLATVAMTGYDGGAIARRGLADHVIITRSQSIPRIQEAQASAWHVLRELIEQAG
jgi:D-sedoheptulose 7-phosphate isomerase